MQYSIRHRLTLTFVALAVLPLLLVGVILVWQSFTVQQQQAITLQNEVALRVSTEVAAFIEQIEQELRLTTQLQALPKLTYEEQQTFLSKLQTSLDVIEGLTLLDNEGQELARVSRVEIVTADDLGSRAEAHTFLKSQESEQAYYSAVRFDEATAEPLITMGIPLVDVQDGKSNGVLVADIRLKRIWDFIASIEVNTGEQVYIVDGEGKVIAHRNPSVVLRGTSFDVPEEDGIKQGLGLDSVVLAVEWLEFGEQRFAIVTERSLSEAFALAINTLLIMGIVIVIALLVASGLAVFVVSQIVQPMQTLAVAAQAIKAGDLSQQVEISNKDEIGLLGQAFNAMAAQLRQTIDMLQERERASLRFTTQLRAAADLAHKINGILDLDELLSETMSQLQSRFELYHVHIYLVSEAAERAEANESSRQLVMHTGSGEVGQLLRERQHAIPYNHEQSLVARAAQTGEVVLVNDVRHEPTFMPNALLPDTRSEIAVPLLTGGRLLGVLDVQDNVLERFSESDADVFSIVAGQIAIALENARLFEQKEEALEVTRLRLKVNEAFIGLQSEQDVLDTIMEEATFHKDARVMLLLIESEGEDQKFVLVDGRSLESGLPSLPIGLSLSFKAYPLSQYTTTQALFVTNNVLTDERIDEASRAVMKRTGTVSLLTAQLAVGKQLYGLLSVGSKEADYFDEHKIRLHQILAERSALALHEARLRAATEEARAEAEHERNLLNSILSTLPVGVYVSDKEGKAMRTNKMARLLLGYDIIESPEEELTELYHVVYSESDVSYPPEKLPLLKTLTDGLPHSCDDIAVIQPDGTKVDLLVNSGALVDQKGEMIGATVAFSDISQRRRTEEALAKANQELIKGRDELELRVEARTAELAQLNQDLEHLLYIISHDLKEPLRAIQNFSRLVIRRYGKKLDAKGQDYLARVDRAGARLRTLIDDILTLSRAQRMELRLEPIASEKMVRDILERLEAQIQESEAEIEVAADLPQLQVNRTWATQAIYNLISNALKYRRYTSGKALPPELSISRYEGAEGIGLAVKDRGPGVPKEYAERIFQLFQRAVGREIEGTGAGLAIVRQIAQRHGGHAWVSAREGGGSEFIITFGRAVEHGFIENIGQDESDE